MDAGNALFSGSVVSDRASLARATFILRTMKALGTAAMAPGPRDFGPSPRWLKEAAGRAGLTVLSANLRGPDRQLVFRPSLLTEVGGVKVALIGASPAGPVPGAKGYAGDPAAAAVLAEARRLRQEADVVVVLGALPFADALQLAQQASGDVDFVLQSSEGRGLAPQRMGGVHLVPGGDRGRGVGVLSLSLQGTGAFLDAREAERSALSARHLDEQLAEVDRRLDRTADRGERKDLEQLRAGFVRRRDALLAEGASAGGRSFTFDAVWLGADRPSDPALAAAVQKYAPAGHVH